MGKSLYPCEDYNSIYDIDFKKYREKGCEAVLFDIDNTLVPHDAPAKADIIVFFQGLHEAGLKTCLISNNKEARVKLFADQVNSPYIFKADKPSAKGYQAAMDLLGSSRENTIFVGDQIFTDILGANHAGIKSILVRPINPKEEIQIVIKRYFEKIVLFFYYRYKNKKS